MHPRDHADSEYVPYVEVDRKGAEFIGDKQIHSFTRILTLTFIMPAPYGGGGIQRCFCLTFDVCLSVCLSAVYIRA